MRRGRPSNTGSSHLAVAEIRKTGASPDHPDTAARVSRRSISLFKRVAELRLFHHPRQHSQNASVGDLLNTNDSCHVRDQRPDSAVCRVGRQSRSVSGAHPEARREDGEAARRFAPARTVQGLVVLGATLIDRTSASGRRTQSFCVGPTVTDGGTRGRRQPAGRAAQSRRSGPRSNSLRSFISSGPPTSPCGSGADSLTSAPLEATRVSTFGMATQASPACRLSRTLLIGRTMFSPPNVAMPQ